MVKWYLIYLYIILAWLAFFNKCLNQEKEGKGGKCSKVWGSKCMGNQSDINPEDESIQSAFLENELSIQRRYGF